MFPTHTLRDPKRDLLIVKAIHVAGVFTLEERGVGQQVRRTFLLTSMTPQQRWWHEHATWTETWVLTGNCMPWYSTSRSGTHEQCLFSVWRTITPPSFTSTQPQMMTYTAATTKLKNSTLPSNTERGVCVNKGHILKLPCGNNATVEDNKRVRHCRWINVLFLNKSGIYIMKKKPCTVT